MCPHKRKKMQLLIPPPPIHFLLELLLQLMDFRWLYISLMVAQKNNVGAPHVGAPPQPSASKSFSCNLGLEAIMHPTMRMDSYGSMRTRFSNGAKSATCASPAPCLLQASSHAMQSFLMRFRVKRVRIAGRCTIVLSANWTGCGHFSVAAPQNPWQRKHHQAEQSTSAFHDLSLVVRGARRPPCTALGRPWRAMARVLFHGFCDLGLCSAAPGFAGRSYSIPGRHNTTYRCQRRARYVIPPST
jgi:hypothetical protein